MKGYNLPIIDIESLQDNKINDITESEWETKAKEFDDAFTEYGFVYLKNHGIKQEIVEAAQKISHTFFQTDKGLKRPFTKNGTYFGYYYPGDKLTTDVKDLIELREMWDVPGVPNSKMCPVYPPVENYQETLDTLMTETRNLIGKLLRVISRALGLNENYLGKIHKGMNNPDIFARNTFRCLYYPALDKDIVIPPNGIRCREHTDYGTITLIFQDLVGGLQMQLKDGTWVDAAPIPDTIVVNVCDMLGRLTGNYYAPILHRVPVPDNLSIPRQSISYFVVPDDDVLIEPVVEQSKVKINCKPVHVHEYYTAKIDYFGK